jgi:hypothetical protein
MKVMNKPVVTSHANVAKAAAPAKAQAPAMKPVAPAHAGKNLRAHA